MFQPPDGATIDIEHLYRRSDDVDEPFDELAAIHAAGRTPLLTIEPWDGPGYLFDWLPRLGRLDGEVYLRYGHEMNGNWYPWAGDPSAFVEAWRDLAAHLTPNVKTVWCPNITYDTQSPRIKAYWPGRSFVDVIGLDGYDWNGQRWTQVFAPTLNELDHINTTLPRWICETASPAGPQQADWVADMLRAARRRRDIAAIVWFNADKERDWRLTPDALAGFTGGQYRR
jgi:hypothetical protein